MKKITSILLVVCLLGALCACGAAAEPEPSAVTDEIIASLSIASPLNVPAERLLALCGPLCGKPPASFPPAAR